MRGVLILIVVLLLVGLAWAAGLFNVDTSGHLKAPQVAVSGGEIPKVQVETAKINVGSKTETVKTPEVSVGTKNTSVKVPTISVDKPSDDGSANK